MGCQLRLRTTHAVVSGLQLRHLEQTLRDSIIEAKGYRGTYVHPKAKANCKFNLQEWTLRKLSETIAELREAGVTDSEIRNAFAGAISRPPPAK